MGKAQPVLVAYCFLLVSAATVKVSVSMKRNQRRMKEKVVGLDDGLAAEGYVSDSCSYAMWEDHLVVAARYDEDVSWMAADLNPWLPFLVFSINGDKNATHATVTNTGREAQAYLQFIVTYYTCLPQYAVFLHAHQFSAHSVDIVSDLKRLRWDEMPGFLSMSRPTRTNSFSFSDPESHKPDLNDTSETAHWSQFAYEQLVSLASTWPLLFGQELGEPPAELSSPAAGQFVVSRERILAHPLSFYQGLLQWLQRDSMDGFWAGLIFEQTWSYIFGAGPTYQHPEECAMFMCGQGGEPVVPDWRVVMHKRRRRRGLRASRRHQAR